MRASPRLPTTVDLLTRALKKDTLRAWARRLEVSEEALRVARFRGRLSPVLAGCIAEDLQLDAARWIVVAALETERDTACKSSMVRHFSKEWSSMGEEIKLPPP
ncbi:hypothetical protein WDL1P2_00568 (plasmid) [Variovorax sp. WDL1]|nr:hypothetical protein CHC06_06681 [Variovorax sp. B2]PNG49420.1 hypothetical protein CHC07_06329 [Variovorax sp. B4]VTV18961.1 hypothetical protein WDL1P2_00568 [Variovorax sp. WDL1]